MSIAEIISLDEWRTRSADHGPEDPPPFTPALRLVEADERPGEELRLDVFLSRARLVLAETDRDLERPRLYSVPAS